MILYNIKSCYSRCFPVKSLTSCAASDSAERSIIMRAFTLACLIAATLLILTSLQPREVSTVVPTPVVAVCISGASRGPATLRAFAAALETHLMEPARRAHNARFELFGWLQDDPAAERLLAQLLPSVVTRRTVGTALPPELALDEDTAIRTEHGHVASVGPLTGSVNLTNTLRMLRKMRGCEWLRQRQQARSVQPHALVVRIRPDLLLLEPLSLPLDAPPPPDRAWAWHCAEQRVASDQLLVGGPALAVRVGELYLPAALRAATERSQPPSTYPERLVWQHLVQVHGFRLQPLPSRTALVADSGGARAPLAKLRRDFPSAECPYPTADRTEVDLRAAMARWREIRSA